MGLSGQVLLPTMSQSVLVLGGCHDHEHVPVGDGLYTLTVLAFESNEGSVVRWHEEQATGTAPRSIWHHTAGSFAGGTKVVVFGGDFARDDAEFAQIRDRAATGIM